jgi:glutamate racemase
MWVPIIENGEHESEGADYFVNKYVAELLAQSSDIDCILLACTHYPLLIPKIQQQISKKIKLLSQGKIVADSLAVYLNRHPEIENNIGKQCKKQFFTSGDTNVFDEQGSIFFGAELKSEKLNKLK